MEALYVHIATKLEGIRTGGGPESGNKLLRLEELKTIAFWRAVFAEFLAQIVFVFMGCASAVITKEELFAANAAGGGMAWIVKISLTFGLCIMALIQMVGHVSGGHINPAVSIAMAVSMNISVIRCLLYVIAQCVGAILGGLLLKGVTNSTLVDKNGGLAVTSLAADVTPAQGFAVEFMLTFVLVTVIYGTTDPNRASFGSPAVLIGLTVTLGHLAGIQYTGSSMNPSRSLGSAVASDKWDDHWVYWIGPIVGGIVASLVYKFVLCPYHGVTSMEEAIQKMKNDLPGNRLEEINMKSV